MKRNMKKTDKIRKGNVGRVETNRTEIREEQRKGQRIQQRRDETKQEEGRREGEGNEGT